MLKLLTKSRQKCGRKTKSIRKEGFVPAVLYGPEIKAISLEVNKKDFLAALQEAGESSLISLGVDNQKEDFLVLIHDVQLDSLAGEPIHIDFYQPRLKEKVEVVVLLSFIGEAPVIKNLGGTLVKNIHELVIRAFPQDLPKEIIVDVSCLDNFDKEILVKDLKVPAGVEILREGEEAIARVLPPENVEQELEKPIEEKVDEIERVKEEKEEEEEEEKKEEGGAAKK